MLQGKTVLVTGASKGIGQAIATEAVRQGAHVIAHYGRDRAGAEAALRDAAEGRASLVQADLSDPAEARGLFEKALAIAPRIDGVVNNAATMIFDGGIDDPPRDQNFIRAPRPCNARCWR